MSLVESFFYGMIQGLTEYLPVSSSAHLLLFPAFLGVQDPGLAFDVFLHMGTLASTLVYFWKDLVGLIPFRSASAPSTGQIVIATLPAVIAGIALKFVFPEGIRSVNVTLITLPLFGFLLFWVDRRRPDDTGAPASVSWKQVLGVGFAQALALVPGVSRSGITITAGRALHLNRKTSTRLSFLLSVPVTAGAIAMECRHPEAILSTVGDPAVLWVGAGSAFVFGWIAIRFMITAVSKMGYLGFFVYRTLLALAVWFWA